MRFWIALIMILVSCACVLPAQETIKTDSVKGPDVLEYTDTVLTKAKAATRYDELGMTLHRVFGPGMQTIVAVFDSHADPSRFTFIHYGSIEVGAFEDEEENERTLPRETNGSHTIGVASRPICFQFINGKRVEVPARFKHIDNTSQFRLWIGAHDSSLPLVVKYRSRYFSGSRERRLPPPEM